MSNAVPKILLLEDSPVDAILLKKILTRADGLNWQVVHVERLSDALQQVQYQPPDLVLTDLSLPDAQGLESVIQLHATVPHLPIVVLTGHDDETLGLEAVRQGAQDYLSKGSVSYGALAKTLRYAMERSQIQKVMRQQAAAMAASREGIAILSDRQEFTYANSAFAKIYGYESSNHLMGQGWTVLYPLAEAKRLAAEMEPAMQQQGYWCGESISCNASGERCYQEISLTALHEDGFVYTVRDVTERKQAEEHLKASLEEKNVLLKEIHHRVKNNLQTISSLLRLQVGTIQDAATRERFQESQNRVHAMALVHEKLYQSASLSKVNLANYVNKLVTDLVESYAAERHSIQVNLYLAQAELEADIVIPCGLIINELVSNALKYAFPDTRVGKIDIQFDLDAGDRYLLSIKDDGVGIPDHINFRETKSLGLKLVCLLTKQLRGEVELCKENGTLFKIRFDALTKLS